MKCMLRIAEGDAFWEGLKMAFAPRIQLTNKAKIKTILDLQSLLDA